MHLKLLFFARLRREIGTDELPWKTDGPLTVQQLAAQVEAAHCVSLKGCMVAVNEAYAAPDVFLQDRDEVAFLPPVAGGSGMDTEEATRVGVTDAPLSLADADTFLVQPECGAQAYFVGTVRSPNQGKRVEFIEYEGFAPLAERVMRQAADAAREQHGELRVFIGHRLGHLEPGEASILIGVASAHRRAALEACDFLIEFLKVQVPVWKREVDEDGEHWVEGQAGQPTL